MCLFRKMEFWLLHSFQHSLWPLYTMAKAVAQSIWITKLREVGLYSSVLAMALAGVGEHWCEEQLERTSKEANVHSKSKVTHPHIWSTLMTNTFVVKSNIIINKSNFLVFN